MDALRVDIRYRDGQYASNRRIHIPKGLGITMKDVVGVVESLWIDRTSEPVKSCTCGVYPHSDECAIFSEADEMDT